MNQEMESLAQISADFTSAPLSSYKELLAKRRVALDALAAGRPSRYEAKELAHALRAGGGARSRLLVELGSLRAKIEDLRRLRAGLGQLSPTHATTPSLDVRL